MNQDSAILYSFRRCPYAMRARMAIHYAGIKLVLREVDLRDKPDAMLLASPKATVPVLVDAEGAVIEESLEIMDWALSFSDPDGWLSALDEHQLAMAKELINENDGEFKKHLDQYKYADRFPELFLDDTRVKGQGFLNKLEGRLQKSKYLMSDKISYVDIAVFPFIRQFACVDKNWFDESEYFHLQTWLQQLIGSERFKIIMKKYAVWKIDSDDVYLGD